MEAFLVTVGSDDELEYSLMNDPLTRLEESFIQKEVVTKYYEQWRTTKGACDYPTTMETFLGTREDLREQDELVL